MLSKRSIVVCKLTKHRLFKACDGFVWEDLLKCAHDHIRSAKLLFDKHPLCYDSAGYLTHLGIELMLKSILLKLNGEFPAEHNLGILYNLAKKSGARPIEMDEEKVLENIDQFFKLRYIQPQKPIEIGSDDWKMIKQLFYNLLKSFPDDVISRLERSSYYEKGGRILMMKPKEINNLAKNGPIP